MLNREHPISKYLRKHDLSVSAFADQIGRSVATVYRWIDGSRSPSAKALHELFAVSGGALTPNSLIRFYTLHKLTKRGGHL